MRYITAITVALGASVLAMGTEASARIVNFTVTGSDTASWTIDDSLAPAHYDDHSFAYSADFTLNGVTTPNSGITFYDDAYFGGLDNGFFGFLSAQLFSGPTSSPSFLLGTFSAVGFPNDSLSYTVTIATDSAVPEPTTWAMMLLGIGGIGMAMRRKQRTQRAGII